MERSTILARGMWFMVILAACAATANADDWLAGWGYRAPVQITGSSSALTGYQVLVTVDTASLISAGKLRSDCGDLRFTDTDGATLLDYWIESDCNSASTRVWVNVSSIPTGGTTIYMYYGNASAGSTSSGADTFEFYDDCDSFADWSRNGDVDYQSLGFTIENSDSYVITATFEDIDSHYVHWVYHGHNSVAVMTDTSATYKSYIGQDYGGGHNPGGVWYGLHNSGGHSQTSTYSGHPTRNALYKYIMTKEGSSWNYKCIKVSDESVFAEGDKTGDVGSMPYIGWYGCHYTIRATYAGTFGTCMRFRSRHSSDNVADVCYYEVYVRKHASPGPGTSVGAEETPGIAPSITSHPSGATICDGQSHQVCVSASGTAPLSYQWQKDSVDIGGATSSCYTATQAGQYRCIVTNSCGSATSNNATVTVNTAPSITSHPSGATICDGQSHQVCVSASGTAPLSYQWQKDSVDIGGATSSCYTATQAGQYRCVVTNSCGSATSNSATVTVNTAPSITSHPSGATICDGQSHQMSVTASGTAPLSYQWRKNGSDLSDGGNISGATTTTLAINPAALADAGSYDCVVTNVCGSTTSTAATLTVNANPTATASNNGPVCQGSDVTLSAGPGGMASYAWTGPNSFTSGEQNPVVSPAVAGQYCVTVTDGNGCTGSACTDVVVDTFDTDGDGVADCADDDDDNDGVADVSDPDTLNPDVCGDSDGDTCDDCSVGTDDFGPQSDQLPGNDGTDTDGDGLCDAGDTDDDGDGVADGDDSHLLDPYQCRDVDGDSCDDCSSGTDDPANDGTDTDSDGLCDDGDTDDDGDGVPDGDDSHPLDQYQCRDVDGDTCDDCSSGTDDFGPLSDQLPGNDGADFDGDGACDAGDSDIDNDGRLNADDSDDFNPNVCADTDADGCDDCSSGTFDPANDGTDTDGDGLCDAGDTDDDNDGVLDDADTNSLNPDICQDTDGDGCDDCSVGTDNFGPLPDNDPANDGLDTDSDGLCDAGDTDDDNDGVLDGDDTDPLDPYVCQDTDTDGCDDCSQTGGPPDPANDGTDTDSNGICDAGDPDDDGDGVPDGDDSHPLDPYQCRDVDGDTCDDCSSGTDDPSNDGTDTDGDGLCDSGDTDDDNDGVLDGDDTDPL
ncbi:MAG: DUF2341 domain-containing protein, partial [Phycisphaerae bacterium]|nr:DUF2341 domain-containing protein [Phycisphaerae bacterium]